MDVPNIVLLENTGDRRGFFYSLPRTCTDFLRLIKGAAVISVKPGAERGNHYHQIKMEMLLVVFSDIWTFSHQCPHEAVPVLRKFEGEGMAVITIPPLCSHTIINNGKSDLIIMDLKDAEFDPVKPDVIPRVITD